MKYKKYNKSKRLLLKKIENTLQTLPKIKKVKLEFNKNIIEPDDPIKFVCKGEQGGVCADIYMGVHRKMEWTYRCNVLMFRRRYIVL